MRSRAHELRRLQGGKRGAHAKRPTTVGRRHGSLMLEPALTRPVSVTGAVKLLYATLAIGVVRSLLEFRALAESAPTEIVLTVWSLTITIMLTLVYNIGAGRNWARITLLVLFGLGLPLAIQPLLQSFSLHPFSGVLGV